MTENMKDMKDMKFIKEITVDGVAYTLQKLPVRAGLELRQRCRKGSEVDDIKFYEQLLEHIVIKPRTNLDEFDDIGHLENLMLEVIEYQYQSK